MSKKSKNKKKIRKLEDKPDFSVNIDSTGGKEIFQDYMMSEDFDAGLKYEKKAFDDRPKKSNSVVHREEKKYLETINCKLDLHGMTSLEAIEHLSEFIEAKSSECRYLKLKIITGRGVHSKVGGPVLVKDIYEFVLERYSNLIQEIDDPPADTILDGLAIRGYFNVHLKY